ncbi:uncharacterized protein LOC143076793 [Mytilus galloprovincialis]|uniref:uncharacterized protein LOC143076793 n=1 Tax=Mytilus galloprovincialis TaxID=29158 RepID=UPI003F7B712C
MQDPYSMMHREERFFKPYNQTSSASRFPNMPSSSYYGMHYPSHTMTQSDLANMSSGSLDFSQFHPSVEGMMTSSGSSHTMPNPIPAHSSNNMSTLPNDNLSPHSIPTSLPLGHHQSGSPPTMDVLDVLNSHRSSPTDDKSSLKKEIEYNNANELSSPSSTTSNHSLSHQDAANADCDSESDGFRMPPKKRQNVNPESQKDNCYWEKRKKNNESAKRSREARRMKEEQIALRVVYLEQENLQLRTEVSLLKGEIEKLRCMLYNP